MLLLLYMLALGFMFLFFDLELYGLQGLRLRLHGGFGDFGVGCECLFVEVCLFSEELQVDIVVHVTVDEI